MQRREIVRAKPALLQQGNGKSISDGHRHGCAGRGRKIQRTSLFLHADVQRYIAGFRQRRLQISRERDDRDFQPFQRLQQIQDLFRFAAVADGQQGIAARQHTQIAVQRVRRMQKERRRAGARERSGNLAADQPGFSHARHNHASLAGEKHFDRAIERSVESCQYVLNGLGFNAENAARGFQAHALLQRRTREESSFKRARSCASCAKGRALGPSESAAAGLSWVSRKMPSTPAATPARASGSMNSGWPPLAWPCPPGSCTEWVTSKTTG